MPKAGTPNQSHPPTQKRSEDQQMNEAACCEFIQLTERERSKPKTPNLVPPNQAMAKGQAAEKPNNSIFTILFVFLFS
jgi:hypothetical protein